jgi:hypothetical protein
VAGELLGPLEQRPADPLTAAPFGHDQVVDPRLRPGMTEALAELHVEEPDDLAPGLGDQGARLALREVAAEQDAERGCRRRRRVHVAAELEEQARDLGPVVHPRVADRDVHGPT